MSFCCCCRWQGLAWIWLRTLLDGGSQTSWCCWQSSNING